MKKRIVDFIKWLLNYKEPSSEFISIDTRELELVDLRFGAHINDEDLRCHRNFLLKEVAHGLGVEMLKQHLIEIEIRRDYRTLERVNNNTVVAKIKVCKPKTEQNYENLR